VNSLCLKKNRLIRGNSLASVSVMFGFWAITPLSLTFYLYILLGKNAVTAITSSSCT
jgi:hypothetical protein